MSHQLCKQVRVGDMSSIERAERGLIDAKDDEVVNIVVANVVKDQPAADEPKEIKLAKGERIEEIK